MRRIALLVALAGCSAQLPLQGGGDRVFVIGQQRTIDAAFARGGDALLAGFPERLAERGPAPGDSLLFGFESHGASGVARRYVAFEAEPLDASGDSTLYLRAGEAVHELPTTKLRIRVRTFDEHLQLLADAHNDVAAILF